MQENQINGYSPTPHAQRYYAWFVICIASLFFFYELVQMSMFNAISSDLMASFQVSAAKLSWISSGYFYANILFMLPAGIILDRFSTRAIIVVSMLICITGTLLFSFAESLPVAMFARFLTGIGGSFPLLSCMRLASRWIPYKRLALASGLIVTIGMLGGCFAQRPLEYLSQHFGWQSALRLDAAFGALVLVLIFSIVRDFPRHLQDSPTAKPKALSILEGLKLTVNNHNNWIFGFYTCLMNLPVFLLGQTWGSLYLQQVRGLSLDQAMMTTAMIFVGMIIGSPTLGYLSDRLQARKPLMMICAIFAIANIAAIMLIPSLSWLSLSILFWLLGYITSAQVLSYPAIAENNKTQVVGTALGLASVLIMAGGAFGEPLSGWLLDLNWHHIYHGATPWYSSANFFESFLMMPIAFLISLLILLPKFRSNHPRK
ncbi:MAG: hypothetical protein A3F17_05895 [Gammaproteobacteria bacterium RIFCSPHIGHO2_12_FULL_41_15]|nr:MAG: hypothetical protein A3F17_05895 [Gammaproteobacteria bacterium RIFCSPHIGHO2_12_FULL_41_15]